MADLLSIFALLRYAAENVALFGGGLFAGAAIFISLTEQPPRTLLSLTDVLALSRINAKRMRAVLVSLASITALAAILASMLDGGRWWLAGGAIHVAAVVLMLTQGKSIARALEDLGTDPEFEASGKRLFERQALHFSLLSLAGLAAQGLFILKP